MTKRRFSLVTDSPIGPLGVTIRDGFLTGIEFLYRRSNPYTCDDSLALEIERQLKDYFSTSDSSFSLPVKLEGTEFQKSVWRALSRIDQGRVRTYGDIARELKTGPRAVGNACRSNPVPLVIPCHRVVAVNGLGGFSGAITGMRLETKRWLLHHEDALQ